MSDSNKYYYLKLRDTFFDSEDLKLLESQKNGVEYQNLYLKLCLLSLKNSGELIYKDKIPYDLNMLSTILRINIDTVKTGIEILSKLGMIEILETGIMFMTDIQSLIGHNSNESERKAKYREQIQRQRDISGTLYGHCPPEIEIEIERERKIKREIEIKNIIPPTLEMVSKYCKERNNKIDPQAFIDHNSVRGWRPKGSNTRMKDWQAAIRTWERFSKNNNSDDYYKKFSRIEK